MGRGDWFLSLVTVRRKKGIIIKWSQIYLVKSFIYSKMETKPIIKTKDVSVTYFPGKNNEVKSLVDVSIEIFPGEFVIFYGPSGCGKSTLLYTIAGLDRNAVGSIKVFDNEITTQSMKELERHHQKIIGIVFQAFYLISSLSVIQNVMLPQVIVGKAPKERKKKAQDLLTYFGVGDQANKLPTELSGGQQQRIAIARALMNDPEIILADEPVGNLDSKSAEDTLKLIQDLNLKENKTIILVTHDPAHLSIANRIFYMKDGKVIDMKYNEHPMLVGGGEVIKKQREIELRKEDEKPKKSELERLAELHSKEGAISGLLLDYKAKQIVFEALTGLSSEETDRIENNVKELLTDGIDDHDKLFALLDKTEEQGGFGLDRRSASNIVNKIKQIVKEFRFMVSPPEKEMGIDYYVKHLRYYLLDALNININNVGFVNTIKAIDEVIKERLGDFTDRKGVQAVLDSPISEGGAGLDRRSARKMARLLELVILGRYSKRMEDYPMIKNIKDKIQEIK